MDLLAPNSHPPKNNSLTLLLLEKSCNNPASSSSDSSAPVPQDCEAACEFSVGLGALLLLLVGLIGRGCNAAGVALRALGGVWSACWVLVGRGGGLVGGC